MEKDKIKDIEDTDDETAEDNEENEDNIEMLLAEYDNKRSGKADDVPAMQTVMCIILATLLFGLNALYPAIGGELFARLTELTADNTDTFRNPIDIIISML